MSPPTTSPSAVVFVDLDDTLWENARHFDAVLAEFRTLAQRLGHEPDHAVLALERCEARNIPHTGYGTEPFLASVRETLETLHARSTSTAAATQFLQRADRVLRHHPLDPLPGVEEGLARLAAALPLEALTKGRTDEQTAKFERFPLRALFRALHVVPDKTDAVYAELAGRSGYAPEQCWMVGNSPRSDVNPARRAGWRTVLVAHAAPWHHELEPLVDVGHATLVARTFADVPDLILGAPRVAALVEDSRL